MAKKAASAGKKSAAAKKGGRKPRRTWNVYIQRALRALKKNKGLSSKLMKILNSFVGDLFDRLATEAANLVRVNKKRTLGAREIQTAVRLVLPADLAKHAMAEGTKAVKNVSA